MRVDGFDILTTAYCLTTTTNDNIDSIDEVYTALTSVSSTIATIAPQHIEINITNDYMSSLSDQQLVEMEDKLLEKEIVMAEEIEQPKVLKKG